MRPVTSPTGDRACTAELISVAASIGGLRSGQDLQDERAAQGCSEDKLQAGQHGVLVASSPMACMLPLSIRASHGGSPRAPTGQAPRSGHRGRERRIRAGRAGTVAAVDIMHSLY